MTRTRISRTLLGSSLLTALLGVAGCDDGSAGRGFGGDGAGPSGGKADDAEPSDLGEVQTAHLDAVGSCETRADRDHGHTSDLRVQSHVDIETQRRDCVKEANDDIVVALEATMERSESSLAGTADEAFSTWRSAQSNLCELLTDASEQANTKASGLVTAGCWANAELQLAELVQAFADLGGPRAEAPGAADIYPDCYDAFETETQGESPDVSAAAAHLGACIRQELVDEAGVDLAIRIAAAYPGRDEDMILQDVETRFARHQTGATDACMVLAAASPAAGTDAAELEFQGCTVTASIWLGRLIGDAVPDLEPEPAGDPEPEPDPDQEPDPAPEN